MQIEQKRSVDTNTGYTRLGIKIGQDFILGSPIPEAVTPAADPVLIDVGFFDFLNGTGARLHRSTSGCLYTACGVAEAHLADINYAVCPRFRGSLFGLILYFQQS